MSIRSEIPSLSPREQQLIEFAAEGLTDAAIALRLGISEATVGTYWGRVRIKIGPFNRTELVSIYLRHQQQAELSVLREKNEELVALLRSSEAAAGDDLFHRILENAPDAILLVSEAGTIVSANATAAEMFGYERQEMEGLPITTLIPERYREAHAGHRDQYFQNPSRRTMAAHEETPALRKDQAEIIIRATLSAVATPAGLLATCILREVPHLN